MNREELRRLQKAARDNDKRKLLDWGNQFENQIRAEYEKEFKAELTNAVDNFMIAVAYTLRYCEETEFGQKRLTSFLEDLGVTIDMYRTGEYKPEEYAEDLKKSGVIVKKYDYDKLYRNQKELHNKMIGDSVLVCRNCENCDFKIDVTNPETGKVEMNMCSNKQVIDRLLDKTFSKDRCEYKKETK